MSSKVPIDNENLCRYTWRHGVILITRRLGLGFIKTCSKSASKINYYCRNLQVSLLRPFCMYTYILYIESHERPSREQSVVSGFYLKDCIKTTLKIYTCVLSISQPFLQIQGLVLNEMFHRKIAICEVVKKEQNCRNFCKKICTYFSC